MQVKNYFVKAKIDLSEILDTDGIYVVVREPNVTEMAELNEPFSSNNEKRILESIVELLPSIIIEHNFTDDKDKLIGNKEVVDIIIASKSTFGFFFEQFKEKILFFTKAKKGK